MQNTIVNLKNRIIDLKEKEEWENILRGLKYPLYFNYDYCYWMSRKLKKDIYLYEGNFDDKRVVAVFCKRIKYKNYVDIYTPNGYSGIITNFNIDSNPNIVDKVFEYFKEQGFITYFAMQHPLFKLSNNIEKWNDTIYEYRDLYVIDLNLDLKQLWENISKTYRYEIRKNEKLIKIIRKKDNDMIDILKSLYDMTIKRVKANDIYYYSKDDFKEMLKINNVEIIAVLLKNKIKAISVFIYDNDIAEYFINAAEEDGKTFTKNIIWEAIKIFKENGLKYINLGGGIKDNDGLSFFKKHIGGKEIRNQVIRKVIDDNKYKELCEKFDVKYKDSGYFPPYWYKNE